MECTSSICFSNNSNVHFIVILFNDDDDNVIVITLEVIFYTTVVFEIKNMYKTLSFIYIMSSFKRVHQHRNTP